MTAAEVIKMLDTLESSILAHTRRVKNNNNSWGDCSVTYTEYAYADTVRKEIDKVKKELDKEVPGKHYNI